MRKRTRRIAVFALLAVSAVVVARSAVSQEGAGGKGEPDMAAMMKKWMAAAEPGEMHKHLEPLVGDWKTTTKVWWGGAGSQPSTSPGTSKVQWVLGGRYVSEMATATFQMPGPDGQLKDFKMEGMGVTGYDNFKKAYTFGWADNMSTQLITGLGHYDAKSKTFTCYGEMDEPMLDAARRPTKYVHRILDNDKHVFEIHDLSTGTDGEKVMEVTYERVK